MKKILLTLIALMPILAFAQVKFVSMSFADAQAKAQKAGKQIMVDVSRGTAADANIVKIFKNKELAKFINNNFLLVRIDMNDKANSDFGQYLYSLMYPCVGFYSNRGEQLEATNWHSVANGKHDLKALAGKSLETAAIKRANTRQINFRELDFKQALEVAKKEGKMVFTDNYTTWCRPCKQMEMDVFTLNSVADYYNENFVCIKLDADKDPYKVAKNNGVRGYPSYLYFAPEGDLVFTEGGFNPEKPFIGFGEKALQIFNDNKEIKLQEITLEEAKAQAKKEGKMIFVDLSATWCGPCKQLKATTFKAPTVARFYNSKFVCMFVECDIQKELAEQLKKQYDYSAFPTMLYLNADGELVHKIVGSGMTNEEFIAMGQTAIDDKGLKSYNDRFAKGERSAEFIKEYVEVLGNANEGGKASKISSDYLNSLSADALLEDANFKMMKENVKDLDNKAVQSLLANKNKVTDQKKKEELANYENILWSVKAYSFVDRKNSDAPTFDKAGYNAYMKRLAKSGLSKDKIEDIVKTSKMINAENMNDWAAYVKLAIAQLKSKKNGPTIMQSYNWGLRVDRNCKNPALRAEFLKAFEASVKDELQKEPAWKQGVDNLITNLKK